MKCVSPSMDAQVVPLHGASGPEIDEIALAAWIAQAECAAPRSSASRMTRNSAWRPSMSGSSG